MAQQTDSNESTEKAKEKMIQRLYMIMDDRHKVKKA